MMVRSFVLLSTSLMVSTPAVLVSSFVTASVSTKNNSRVTTAPSSPTTTSRMVLNAVTVDNNPQQEQQQNQDQLYLPNQRDEHYGSNIAQYLVDLHDAKATFNFCGGMMFQLVLSDMLRNHLVQVAAAEGGKNKEEQPIIFSKDKSRMFHIPNYEKSASADNIHIFHGREIRKVTDAAGGMGMVLQLSLANSNDPEGWTSGEINDYDGWGHDTGRVWRNGIRIVKDGFTNYRTQFGSDAFGLHHRFYLHFDSMNQMWLSAEDGCEGTPQPVKGNNKAQGWFGGLF